MVERRRVRLERTCADELVVARRGVEVAAAFPLGRRRRHAVAAEGRVEGIDAGVEHADDDALAEPGGVVPPALRQLQSEELPRVRRQQLVHLVRHRRDEPWHAGQRVELLLRQPSGEAARDVVVRVDEPLVLWKERLVPCRPVVVGRAEHVALVRLHVNDERTELIAGHRGDDDCKEKDGEQRELGASHGWLAVC